MVKLGYLMSDISMNKKTGHFGPVFYLVGNAGLEPTTSTL